MPFEDIMQPEILQLNETLRLKKYDGQHEKAVP